MHGQSVLEGKERLPAEWIELCNLNVPFTNVKRLEVNIILEDTSIGNAWCLLVDAST